MFLQGPVSPQLSLLLVAQIKPEEMTGEFCHLRPVTCMKRSRLGKNLLVFEENKSEVDVLGVEVLEALTLRVTIDHRSE